MSPTDKSRGQFGNGQPKPVKPFGQATGRAAPQAASPAAPQAKAAPSKQQQPKSSLLGAITKSWPSTS